MRAVSRRRAAVSALVASLCFGLSACGSSSSSNSSASSAASGSGSSATTSQTQSGGSSQVQAAAAAIAPYERTPTSIGQTQPLTRRPTGKVFDFIDDGTPFDQQLLAGVREATSAIGARLQVVQQQGDTPQAIQVAWNQVVAHPPDAVMTGGDPTVLYHRQLATLHSEHVPVIAFFTNEDPLLAANIYGPPQYKQLGMLEADYIIAKSGGKAHVLVLAVPEISGLQGTVTAMLAQFKAACSSCTAAAVDTQLTDIGKNDPTRVVSYVQQNPSTNWIVFVDADEQIGVPEALAGAGVHGIDMMSGAGGKVNYAYIKSGVSTVDASQPASFSGWALVDAAGRVLAGQPANASLFPMQFLTKQDLTFNIDQDWPDVPNFRQKFEALWGVGK
jgi:ribose transport system substrate-binding protein